jgi:hypothetical protein
MIAFLADDPALRQRVREVRPLAYLTGRHLRLSSLVHDRAPQIGQGRFSQVAGHFQGRTAVLSV